MIYKTIILKNLGIEIHNDKVHPEIFNFTNDYTFLISPKSKYWRFGVRFSKNSNIEFFHPDDRYKLPNFNYSKTYI